MRKRKCLMRGVLAGVAGGLAASWVMNEFLTGPGQKLQKAVSGPTTQEKPAEPEDSQPKEDATMKAADAIVSTATGGKHLSWEQKKKAGPVVHYTFGAIMGGLYGGLGEYIHAVTSGFGTTFGGVLFASADMFAVPTLNLSGSSDKSVSSLASPFAAHIIYGVTTEAVRRLVRLIL